MSKRFPFTFRLSIALLMIVSLLAPAGIGFAAINITGTPNSTSSDAEQITSFDDSKFAETSLPSNVVDALKSTMTDFIKEQAQTCHYDIKSLTIDITSEKSYDNIVEVSFDTQYLHKLNIAKPEDAAVIKGQIKYLNEHSKEMSNQSIGIVQDRIAQWKSTISDYMNTYIPLEASYKVTAQLDNNNNIVPDTVKLYGEDELGNYINADNFKGHGDNEVELQSYDATKMLLDNYSKTAGKIDTATASTMSTRYTYSGGLALNYAVQWVKNDPPNVDCSSTTHQDHNYYNNSSYTWYVCNDCANYVSQAMHAGGIPMDYPTWYGNTSTTSVAWCSVPDLRNYMTQNGHWHSTTWAGLLSGGVIDIPSLPHVMMCIYNDGSLMEFAAHSYDRKYASFGGGSGVNYWNVS